MTKSQIGRDPLPYLPESRKRALIRMALTVKAS